MSITARKHLQAFGRKCFHFTRVETEDDPTNVTGIDTSTLLNALQLSSAQSASSASRATSTTAVSTPTDADSVHISKQSELYNQLKQLQQSDPDKFKQVVSNIAGKLSAAASSTDDPSAKEMMTNTAKKFTDVANGADISELDPSHRAQSTSSASSQNGISAAYAKATERGHHSHSGFGGSDTVKSTMDGIMDDVDAALGTEAS